MSGPDPLPSQHQDIPSDIRAQLEARGIAADDRLIALIQVVLDVTQTRGTMVAADEIERWQSLVPDAGERMTRRVEVEQIHRHGLQRLVLYADFGLKSFAQLIGLVGSLAGMYVAYLLVSAGFRHTWRGNRHRGPGLSDNGLGDGRAEAVQLCGGSG